MVSGSLAEEFEKTALVQSMRLDRQMDEQSLKRWGYRFDSSGSEVCGTHACSDARSDGLNSYFDTVSN
jgi:hypothetical protein